MKARARSAALTLALAAVAAALIAAAVLIVGREDRAEQARKDAAERLFPFAPAEVEEVALASERGEVAVARAGQGWRVLRPVPGPADDGAVDLLVERLATLRRKAEVAPGAEADAAPARFGLDHPFLTVTARLRGGRTETLAVGRENGFDGSHFARVAKGPVVLIAPSDRHLLDRSPEELAAKRPVPAPTPPSHQ
ncbi:DUF4340 domain-containing protein [Anaeromyxobacter paludicola]|uniref:DUF4340 domain-containing protein n=1 Tax=Anaeromyxobacter paludicola TaxID=2918171 RepID=A0ABM7XAM6_9BACT|nr:DUF4340 domain-containing protein [Anaeromyxobacter paludicola]BDG08902.1 hypothetical protein AMPC_20150 [Anaeromyxobacter paludicola]